MARTTRRVAFKDIPLETRAEGARHQVALRHGTRVRVLEVTDRFVETDWCTTGHVAYVLEGRLELTFDSGTEIVEAGDAFVVSSGQTDRHKARSLAPLTRLFVVDEADTSV